MVRFPTMSLALFAGLFIASCGGNDFTTQPANPGTGGAGAGGSGAAGTGGTSDDAGQDSSAGGTGGSGSTGGVGGSAGAGGVGGQGGTGTGGTAGTGGDGGDGGVGGVGGTGGTGGVGGVGGTGQGGSGGTTCPPFDACAPSTAEGTPCNPCVQEVCSVLPFCCQSAWDAQCALFAHTLGECQCGGLACTIPPQAATQGSCVPGGVYCNPLSPVSPCGSGQCALSVDEGQMEFACYPLGDRPPCAACNPSADSNCQAGLSCIAGLCVSLCCGATDCGAGSQCNPGILPGGSGGLGICVN